MREGKRCLENGLEVVGTSRVRQGQEDLKFKANLGYITRSCLKEQALGI